MITLYWCPQTRASRAFWVLEEVGVPYETKEIDIRSDERSEEFLSISPLGKVPALTDGDLKIADSAAIALYLADRYASGRLAPALDDPARGEFLYWQFYTPSAIEPAIAEKVSGLEPNPVSYPWGSFDKMLAAIETRITDREWITWDRFTVADIMVGGSLAVMRTFGMTELTPTLASYADRCVSRPASGKAVEKELALID